MILKGSDRKKVGTVLSVIPRDNRVIVQGVNIRTFHQKPKTRDEKGTIEKREASVPLSNVALVDPKEKKPTRIGYSGTGKEKRRVARRSGTVVERAGKKGADRKKSVVKKAAQTVAADGTPEKKSAKESDTSLQEKK